MDLLQVRQEDQFQKLQSSASKILSELLQSNSKVLPAWPGRIRPDRDTTKIFAVDTSPSGGVNVRLAKEVVHKLTEVERNVLDSLNFLVMQNRETEIASAEAATFDWIFRDPRVSDRPWHNFYEWLSGHGSDRLYWISGKAGSGKSTLMKHLVRHESTKQGLQKWAGGTKLLISSFFFWYNGHEMQRSQIGLLRAIL